ncbi:MAG: carboxypeptidase-like regulatory domain-containing protein [Planctomycetota bacterium]
MLQRAFGALLLLSTALSSQAPESTTPAAESTYVLEGRVVDLRGEGVPLAKVWVATWQDPDKDLARSVCDGEGYFRIGKVPRRTDLVAFASAESRCRAQSYMPRGPVTLTLHDATTVRGTLKNRAGEPVAGAIVRAELSARVLFSTRSDAVTDDAGHFVLRDVPLGPVRFAAAVAGEGIASAQLRVAAETDLALAPDNAPTTTLRIVVDGMPKAGMAGLSATVYPYANGHMTRLPPPFDKAKFDAEGRCEWNLVPDFEYVVAPHADGFAFAPREARTAAATSSHVLSFTATALGTTSLQCPAVLRDKDGQPITGVALVLRASNGGPRAEASSADDGTLTFASPLAAGTKVIIYSTDDRWVLDQTKQEGMYGMWDKRFLSEHECEVDPTATLALRAIPACTVQGRVLRPDGRAAAFTSVEIEEQNPNRTPRWMTFARATTDRDGNFRLTRLHPDENQVRIEVGGSLGACEGEPFDLSKPGSSVDIGEVKLAPPATIEGVVLDAQQQPAPGIRVWLRDWDFTKGSQKSGGVLEVITDRQGRYRFAGVAAGGAWLQLLVDEEHPTNRAVEPFDVEAGKTYTFDLQVPSK